MPVLSKSRFYAALDSSQISHEFVLTLVLITAKLIGFDFIRDGNNVNAQIDNVLSLGYLEEEMFGELPSLDQLRNACLLAFYEFHQFPGRNAWLRIGKITRIAYWMGLDRLEDPRILSSLADQGHIEDWRLVWWSIYLLDSYANLSAGTPYLINEGLVATALVQNQQPLSLPNGPPDMGEKLFLPSQPQDLYKLASSVAVHSQPESTFNFHVITTTAMRQVGRAMRMHAPRLKNEMSIDLTDIERSLSALRLALSANYLNPMRNAFADETSYEHHARLVTVLHLHMSRLLVSILRCASQEEGNDWLCSWQQNLETCQDIASISDEWNGTYMLSIDPAISFILFTALIFLDVHSKSTTITTSHLQSNLEHCQRVLLLHLEQFSRIWTLPRLLVCESRI